MATDVTSPASSVSVTDPYGICDDQALLEGMPVHEFVDAMVI